MHEDRASEVDPSAPFARGADPPYVAVIFTSVRTDVEPEDYAAMAAEMERLAALQPGHLGLESARESIGITVSYWRTEEDAVAWKRVTEHLDAQRLGRLRWYSAYRVRIATVHRDYGWPSPAP